MIARELKEKLRRRETQVGTFVKLAAPPAGPPDGPDPRDVPETG